jgi:acyl-CoA dehydrogenase
MSRIDDGRAELVAWERDRPTNFLHGDPSFTALLRQHLGARQEQHWPLLERTGAEAAGRADLLARETNRDEQLPTLRRHDGLGRRGEEVIFSPAYHELGAIFWRSGVLAGLGEPGNEVLSGALACLLDHNGEAGHACPVACTAGLIKLLQALGSDDQRARYLPLLLETDYSRRLHAAQFVTEVQGGSDVGSNDCRAEPAPDRPGWFRLSGEKWFCSVADAGVFVVTARPPAAPGGTKGLGLFVVPRLIDGAPNGFALRRLKYKLGTRSMASGEIDFAGALGEPIGPLEHGFRNLVSIVLDTSRVHNALAACGMMRRAYLEAQTFARHRRAFGRPILDYPAVQQALARMKLLTCAALATTFRILALSDRLAAGGGELRAARRIHVNINKYWTAVACTEVVRSGIELLGGNGTIEEFSVLPRLYRDAIVVESWEGTHNTLCAQVLRDFATRALHRPWLAEVGEAIAGVDGLALAAPRERARALCAEVGARIERLFADESYGATHIRQVVDRMCVLHGYVSLMRELDHLLAVAPATAGGKASQLELYRLRIVDPVDPMDHPEVERLQRELSATL